MTNSFSPSLNDSTLFNLNVLETRLFKNSFIFTLLLFLGACSSVQFDGVTVDKKGSTVISAIETEDILKIEALRKELMTLGPNIVPSEANFVARESVLYPKVLANRYKLMKPALFHNVLVNYGKRPRGLCWQWTHDMGKQINRPMKSFSFYHGVAFRRNYWKEHSTLVVAAKGKGVANGIVLDPWRNSGVLFWSHVKDDKKYPWVQFTN